MKFHLFLLSLLTSSKNSLEFKDRERSDLTLRLLVRGAAHHHHLHTHHGDCSTPHVLHRVTIPLLPGQVSPGVDDVLVVNDDQGELAVRGFSSSFISGIYDIPRRFLPQLLLSSLFYLGKQMTSVCLAPRPCPTFPSFPCPTSWLRGRTCRTWL